MNEQTTLTENPGLKQNGIRMCPYCQRYAFMEITSHDDDFLYKCHNCGCRFMLFIDDIIKYGEDDNE